MTEELDLKPLNKLTETVLRDYLVDYYLLVILYLVVSNASFLFMFVSATTKVKK